LREINVCAEGSVVTIGVFDGLHLGHQKVIRQTVEYAHKIGVKSVLLTFKPHPEEVVANKRIKLITSYAQKREMVGKLGIDIYNEIEFTPSFASLSPEEFVQKILKEKLRVRALVLGDNYRFGKQEQGDSRLMKRLGERYAFRVLIVAPFKIEGEMVSSSLIRSLISQGRFRQVERYLGRPWTIRGKVKRERGYGRDLGYPTANLFPPSELILPSGVFIAQVKVDRELRGGLVNIGTRPSFSSGGEKRIEVYILDFSQEIYEKEIEVVLKKRIREEQRFSSREELISQIRKDEEEARRYWRERC